MRANFESLGTTLLDENEQDIPLNQRNNRSKIKESHSRNDSISGTDFNEITDQNYNNFIFNRKQFSSNRVEKDKIQKYSKPNNSRFTLSDLINIFMKPLILFKRKYAFAPKMYKEKIAEDSFRIVKYDKKLRRINLSMFFVAMIGILVIVILESIDFSWWSENSTNLYFKTFDLISEWKNLESRISSTQFIVLSIVSIVFHIFSVLNTILLLSLLTYYYITLSKKEKESKGFKNQLEAFIYSNLWLWYIVEFLLLAYTPFPLIQNLETYLPFEPPIDSEELSILIFIRFYLIFRILRDYSKVYQSRLRIIASSEELKKSDTHFDVLLTWRLLLYSNTFSVFILTAIVSVLIASFSLWVTERDSNKQLIDFREVVYFAFQCLTTVGYGTYIPTIRYSTRLITIGLGFIGFLSSAFFSAVIINQLMASENQIRVSNFNTREHYIKKRLFNAVRIIQLQFLYKKGKCSFRYKTNIIRVCIKKLRKYKREIAKYKITSLYEQTENAIISTEILNEKVKKLNSTATLLKERLINVLEN